ncbi:hypothetical protein M9Y10_041129 [Tritrichomonas musculus]|uniref:Uncharacterized protein n=1 Tax=Tritrichomonas musculus TaxID=1915356 RepID=A0ABR2K5A9_9EUKA
MKLDFRLFLSKLALLLLLSLYQSTYNLPSSTSLRKNKKSNNKFVWFNDRISIIKLINTTIAISTILNKPETSFGLGLDRISSYPNEEFFGNYRTHFSGYYTPQNAFRYAVRSSLAMDFQSNLKVEFQISKRENFAGAHLNYENSKGDVFDKFSILEQTCDDNQIYEIKNDVYNTGTGEKKKLKKSTLHFIQLLSQFFEMHQSYRTNKLSFTKGSAIMPRIEANLKKNNKMKFNSSTQNSDEYDDHGIELNEYDDSEYEN